MIINCHNCDKKFMVEDNLVPLKGRLVECGSCQNRWFFKPSKDIYIKDQDLSIKSNVDTNIINKINDEPFQEIIINENNNKKNHKKEIKNDFLKMILKNFIIILISFTAIIIFIDTFKESISILLPGVILLLDNFYSTLYDLQLFLKDLFN